MTPPPLNLWLDVDKQKLIDFVYTTDPIPIKASVIKLPLNSLIYHRYVEFWIALSTSSTIDTPIARYRVDRLLASFRGVDEFPDGSSFMQGVAEILTQRTIFQYAMRWGVVIDPTTACNLKLNPPSNSSTPGCMLCRNVDCDYRKYLESTSSLK